MGRLFGTDGIRGRANEEPLTTELAFRLGRQLVATLAEHHRVDRVRLCVGRDTRLSGPMLEGALTAGALSAGGDVYPVGVLPTPGIAHLTRRLEAHGGVVLSASHNPFEDNGIKIFSSEGAKLPDAWEDEIENRLDGPDTAPRPSGSRIGRLVPYDKAEDDYVTHACRSFPLDLDGLRIVLDCAHGATYRVAPAVFERLGAAVHVMGAAPDGENINRGSGALHPAALRDEVLRSRADLGLAFDGDGDRLIAVDELGELRDGDFILAICARHLAAHGKLRGGGVVTTVMANLGLDQALRGMGLQMVQTQVGDRYVLEEMLRIGANLGGEQSGHLLFLDHATTGDGIVSALQLLAVVRTAGAPLSSLAACMRKFPQVLLNVPVREKPSLDTIPGLAACIERAERSMDGAGRVLLRYSGTEPLVRVMIEGPDQTHIDGLAAELATLVRERIGQ
ncbi:MAG: phosphoglucosamine mutase [Candidatus Rokubacteria bacterium]|nr:phosphoglucosamine mutase [Candidatus Rokubacteria bacterium]